MTSLPLRQIHRAAIFGAMLYALLPALAAAGDAVAPADPAVTRFDILEYAIEGNTQLTDFDIERAITPFLGEGKSFNEVGAARAALEAAYHNAGYLTVVVTIPEQQVDAGMVTLSVLEGEVERLRVKGSQYHLPSGIKARLPELAEGKVPYFPEVQSQVDALNRAADLKATLVLKAGRTPGTVDVGLDVDDDLPLHGSVELNNRQSPGTRPLRLNAAIRYDNLWQRGHSLGLTAQVAPQATEQMKVLAANYVLPLDGKGDALALYAVHSSSNVPGPTSVLNNSDIAGLRVAMPLPATADYSHSVNVGLDYKAIRRVEGLVGGTESTILQPAINYVPLVASYNGGWLKSGGSTTLDATTTLGLRGAFGNREVDFAAKRPGASAQYLVLRGGLTQSESFGRWSLSGRLEMQLASGMLLPNEQYSAGGSDTVRGYQESEQSGDRAARFGLELRTPGWQLGSAASPVRLTGIGFYEAARLVSLQYDPFTASGLPSLTTLLRGAGVGLRLSGAKGLSFDLDVAKALTDGGAGSNNTKAGDVRLHSRLVWEY
jgi:hemolysin activation/secretion protein